MRKTLLTFLFGASLIFGGNSLKGQEVETGGNEFFWSDFKNNDLDDFNEEVLGTIDNHLGFGIERDIMGETNIYYNDENNDNFHEHIKILNQDKKKRLIIEDFYIDQKTGLIDYSFKKYSLTIKKWNKYYLLSSLHDKMTKNFQDNLPLKEKKFYPNLTGQDFYEMGMDKRVKKLINASKDKDKLKSMLKQERYYWENKPLK